MPLPYSSKPLLYDLFCGQGGASKGYMDAGFEVHGIDIAPQPRYIGDRFTQMDALEFVRRYLAGEYPEASAFHASPPCQGLSEATPMQYRPNTPNLIPDTRRLLQMTGKPYVIENVENARRWLCNPVMLCGTMFELPLWRHRYFETWPVWAMSPASCHHQHRRITVSVNGKTYSTWNPVLMTGGGDGKRACRRLKRPRENVDVVRWAMGIDWMTQDGLTEALPPAYTRWLGEQLLAALGVTP